VRRRRARGRASRDGKREQRYDEHECEFFQNLTPRTGNQSMVHAYKGYLIYRHCIKAAMAGHYFYVPAATIVCGRVVPVDFNTGRER
jgi:hypothetical protein